MRFHDVSMAAEDHNLPGISWYIGRLSLEVDRARRSAGFATDMEKLLDDHRKSQDNLGLASCMIMIGDGILAGPRSSPFALNLVLQEQNEQDPVRLSRMRNNEPVLSPDFAADATFSMEGFDYDILKTLDQTFDTHRCCSGDDRLHATTMLASKARAIAALKWYSQAERLYAAEKVTRGTSLVRLRKVCMLHMLALDPAHL